MARILIVDDEQHVRELYSFELEEEGHEILTAASCYGLLKKVDKILPDLVILDIRLVDCDGLEMLSLLRDDYPYLPVILCSAYDSYKYDARAIAADYYIIKSFDLSELKRRIAQSLQARIPAFPGDDYQAGCRQ